MKLAVFALLGIAIIGLLLFAAFDPSYQSQRQTAAWAQSERERVAVAAEATATALNLQRQQTVAPVATAVQSGMYVSLGLAAGLGVLAGAFFLFLFLARRLVLVRPDRQGVLPTPLFTGMFTDLRDDARASLTAYHTTAYANAVHQPGQVPQHLTYSPHTAPRLDIRNERTRIPEQLVDYALPSLEAAIVPTVTQLLDQQQIGRGAPLLLGYDADEGKPIPGSWLDLFSVGIGGLSGSGKTWTGVFLVSQAMLHGARVAVLDPHAGDVDSFTQRAAPLCNRYICDPAQDRKTMLATVKLFTDEVERRKQRGRGEPWVLVCDEFSALMRGDLAEPLSLLMESIAQEGRKLGIYGLALGQAWQVDRAGGGSMRDSLASCYMHRLRPAQARYLSGLSGDALPGDVFELQPGRAYLLNTRGDLRRVAIPQMVESDVQRVAGLLSNDAATMPRIIPMETNGQPTGNHLESNTETISTAPASATVLSAEAARILAMFQEGGDIPAIVKAVYGVSSGRTYTERSKDVQTVIRQALAGSAA